MHLAMIRAGETAGRLDLVLRTIGETVEGELARLRFFRKETLYTKIVLTVAVMINGIPNLIAGRGSAIVSFIVIPEYSLTDYFRDTIGAAVLIGVGVVAATAILRILSSSNAGLAMSLDRLLLAIPLIGPVKRDFAMARFGTLFAALVESGIAFPTAFRMAGEASGSAVVTAVTRTAAVRVERGGSLGDAFRGMGHVPQPFVAMIQTGEKSGSVSEMAKKAAAYLQSEAEHRAHRNIQIATQVFYLLVAFLIARQIIGGLSSVRSLPA
jgi:type IV pilus assembly protein PilC